MSLFLAGILILIQYCAQCLSLTLFSPEFILYHENSVNVKDGIVCVSLPSAVDERKAIGPDGASGYILQKCRQEMAEPIYDIIEYSLKAVEVLKERKRADKER